MCHWLYAPLPDADGTIDKNDRRQVACIYCADATEDLPVEGGDDFAYDLLLLGVG